MKKQCALWLLSLGYLLGIWRGYVAVWQGEDPMPVQVTPIRESSLPRQDRELLARGIALPEDQPLAAFLEDYLP